MGEWIEIVKSLGFPIALTFFFCWFIVKYMDKWTEALTKITTTIEVINKRLDDIETKLDRKED